MPPPHNPFKLSKDHIVLRGAEQNISALGALNCDPRVSLPEPSVLTRPTRIVRAGVEDKFMRPHNLAVLVFSGNNPPAVSELDQCKVTLRPAIRLLEALWGPNRFQEFVVVYGTREEFIARGYLLQHGADPHRSVIIDGSSFSAGAVVRRGNRARSFDEIALADALALHVYRTAKVIAGARQFVQGDNNTGPGEEHAQTVILPLLGSLSDVMRGRGSRVSAADRSAHYYGELRERASSLARLLYREAAAPREPRAGSVWVRVGRRLAVQAGLHAHDAIEQLPQVARLLALTPTLVGLWRRAKRIHDDGICAAKADLQKSDRIGLATGQTLYGRPNDPAVERFPGLTIAEQLAADYGIDITRLFPGLEYLRGHIAAIIASGSFRRLGPQAISDAADWGWQGINDEARDGALPLELRATRVRLRATRSPLLAAQVGVIHILEGQVCRNPLLARADLDELYWRRKIGEFEDVEADNDLF